MPLPPPPSLHRLSPPTSLSSPLASPLPSLSSSSSSPHGWCPNHQFRHFFRLGSLQLFNCRYKENRWDSKRLLGSGGMPSSHSATVAALSVAVALQDGAGSSAFAISLVLAAIVHSFFLSFFIYFKHLHFT